jgi:hypothetical protein
MASAAPTSTFFGSHPRRAQVPPNGLESTIATCHPASRQRDTTAEAADPVPIAITSNFLVIVLSRHFVFDSRVAGYSEIAYRTTNAQTVRVDGRVGKNHSSFDSSADFQGPRRHQDRTERTLVLDSRLGVRVFLPFAFHGFGHILGRRSQPIRFLAPQVLQNVFRLTLASQMHICGFGAHGVKKCF